MAMTVLLAATPPPPPPSRAPAPTGAATSGNTTSDARHAAAAVAHEAALIAALGGFNSSGVSRIHAALATVTLVTTSDRATLLGQLSAADARGPGLAAALASDGVAPNPDVSGALASLSAADVTAVTRASAISIDPEAYVRALDDLILRNGEHSTNAAPPDISAIAAAMPAIIAADTAPTPTPAPSATTSAAPSSLAAATPTAVPQTDASSTLPFIAALAAAALLLGIVVLVIAARRRRRPVLVESSSAAAVPASRIADLLDVSRRLTAVTATSEMDRAVVREALSVVPAHAAALVRRADGGYSIAHETDPGWLVAEGLGIGIIERVAETGQPVTQVSATEPSVRNLPAAIAAVPLVGSGSVQAVLVLVRDANKPFDADERDLLVAFAPIAAAALYSAGQAAAVVEETLVDPLTGVGNRRRLDSELPPLLADTETCPVSFVMVDLDHFKNVNDTHGHAAGDALLRGVVDAMKLAVRPGDRVYRVGGEEFCVVLPATAPDIAAQVAERMRAAVVGTTFDIGTGTPLTASASFGVASADGGDSKELMRRADVALYSAKESGRNRVESAQP